MHTAHLHAHISINLMLVPVNAHPCSAMQKKLHGEKIPFPSTQTTETSGTHQLIDAHTYIFPSCDLMVIPASLFLYCWMSPPLVLVGTQLHGRDSHAGSVASWYLTSGWDCHAGTSLFSSWYLASNGWTPTLVIKSGDFDYNFHI